MKLSPVLETRSKRLRSRRVLLLVGLTGLALFFASSANAQIITDSLNCGDSSRIDLGSVLAGGTLQDTLYLTTNDTNSSPVFDITSRSNNGFSWTDSTGIKLNPNRGAPRFATKIFFSSSTPGLDSISIQFDDTVALCSSLIEASVQVVGPTANGSLFGLSHTSHNIIAFKSDTSGETLLLRFQNNSGSPLPVDSFHLQSGTAFRIDSSSINHSDTLAPDSSVTLKLSFIASSPGFYSDFIRMPDQPILPFSVQGLLQPNQGVLPPTTATRHVWLYPNPTQGPVTMHTENLFQANAIVTDVLGRTISKQSFAGDWVWNTTSVEGGTYFVTISGITADGSPIHEVHRIEVLR